MPTIHLAASMPFFRFKLSLSSEVVLSVSGLTPIETTLLLKSSRDSHPDPLKRPQEHVAITTGQQLRREIGFTQSEKLSKSRMQ
jgi:hypothetical protein